jgi:lysophospholipase L1-like esterase
MNTGKKVKLLFSNLYTSSTTVIDGVTIARGEGNEVRSDKAFDIKKVTFNKKTKLKMKAHTERYSDEIDFPVKKGERILVSIYLKGLTELTTGTVAVGKYSYGYASEGNSLYAESLPLYVTRDSSKNFLLIGVDVLTENENSKSIICFGDSITAMDWVDEAKSLILSTDKEISLVRKAISGSRVLRAYKNRGNVHYGETGVIRVEKDFNEVKGADSVIILHGINDIIHPDGSVYRPLESLPTAKELLCGYKKYLMTAKKHGMKVYFATVLPFGEYKSWNEDREKIREELNAWIRNLGDEDFGEFDGFVDFDAVVRDTEIPTRMPADLTADHIHPTVKGACLMAQKFFDEIINK